MKKNFLGVCIVLFLILIIGVILWVIFSTPSIPDNVKVSFLDEKPTPVPYNQTAQNVEKKDTSDISLTPNESPANDTVNSATTYEEHPNKKVLYIQDALGERIAKGSIQIASDTVEFDGGEFTFPRTMSGNIVFTVSSEGYFPVAGDIDLTTVNQKNICMEYTSSFSIQAGNEKGSPCPKARIRLWKAALPPRPVLGNLPFITRLGMASQSMPVVTYQQNNFIIKSGCQLSDMPSPERETEPGAGDIIYSLGACTMSLNSAPSFLQKIPHWLPCPYKSIKLLPSSRLRIWDTIYYSGCKGCPQLSDTSESKEICEIQRGGDNLFYGLEFPKLTESMTILEESSTDENGCYQFSNLPPALYYAQAFTEEGQSDIVPLHPCCGGAVLRISSSSNVIVFVYNQGVTSQNANFKYAEHAEIVLKSVSSKGIFSAVTDNWGSVIFPKVAFGQYHLTVKSSNETVEKDIEIVKPKERIFVYLNKWTRFSISGHVFDVATNKPVENYNVTLGHDQKGDGFSTQSDKNGYFIFRDMMPNKYYLCDAIDDYKTLQYSIARSQSNNFFCKNTCGPPIYVTVTDSDVEDVTIPVGKIKATLFSGMVIDESNSPVSHCEMEITFNKYSLETAPKKPETDDKGNFSFKITDQGSANSDVFSWTLSAVQGEKIPAYWKKTGQDRYSKVEEILIPKLIGSVEVSGHTGREYNDIVIKVKSKTNKIIYGKILSEETDLKPFHIHAYQNNKDLPVSLGSDGLITIENVDSGEVKFSLSPTFQTMVKTPSGYQKIQKYCGQEFTVNMPKNENYMNLDITPLSASYVWGYVYNKDKTPIRSIFIQAYNTKNKEEKEENPDGFTQSMDDGFFFLEGYRMPVNEYYYLKIGTLLENQRVMKTDIFKPNIENINIEF